MNAKLEYWMESVESAMEEIGYTNLPIEDITAMAESMIGTAEQESMMFGYDAIPNPLQTEINEITDKLERERNKAHHREYIYRKSIATRNNVNPEDVCIEHGNVWYRRRGL